MTTMSYDTPLAEAAWLTATEVGDTSGSEGLADHRGGGMGEPGWNGYITVHTSSLTARGHGDLVERITNSYGTLGSFDAWISTSGSAVTLVDWGHDEGARSGTDLLWQSWQDAAQ